MNKKQRKIVAVVGPTGSGKTGLGVKLSKEFGGEIVSADSRQVFRGLDLGTGKDLDDLKGVKYHMIDICDPEEKFTLFNWLDRARKIINEVFDRGKTPIVVGGTGLYIQGLIEGFALENHESRIMNHEQRTTLSREELNGKLLKELQDIANAINIDVANIDQKNPRRLIRAIEKHQNQENPTKIKPDFESILIAPKHTKEELYDRIDKRLDQRFEEGMLQETENLIKDGVNPKWLTSLGLDYKVMVNYLNKTSHSVLVFDSTQTLSGVERDTESRSDGILNQVQDDKYKETFQAMKEDLKVKEHQYAKRQLTWWKRFDVVWVKDYKEARRVVKNFVNNQI